MASVPHEGGDRFSVLFEIIIKGDMKFHQTVPYLHTQLVGNDDSE